MALLLTRSSRRRTVAEHTEERTIAALRSSKAMLSSLGEIAEDTVAVTYWEAGVERLEQFASEEEAVAFAAENHAKSPTLWPPAARVLVV
jgi:hypothetical protein